MARVQFHVLPESHSPQRFACTLAADSCRDGVQVHIHAGSREEADHLDDLLWTFRDVSFVPHVLAGTGESAAVTIGWPGAGPCGGDILINLAAEVPEFAGQFDTILEMAAAEDSLRRQARDRWCRYRDMGCELGSREAGSEQ